MKVQYRYHEIMVSVFLNIYREQETANLLFQYQFFILMRTFILLIILLYKLIRVFRCLDIGYIKSVRNSFHKNIAVFGKLRFVRILF